MAPLCPTGYAEDNGGDRSKEEVPMAAAAAEICLRNFRLEFIKGLIAVRKNPTSQLSVKNTPPARKRRVAKTGPAVILKNCTSEHSHLHLHLEDENRVELQALKPWLGRPQRTPDQRREAQLHVLIELVERVKAMLRDVCALANIAVVKVTQHRLTLDVNARVAELEVSLFLQPANASFRPISAALIREAWRVHR